jgi:DNA invertase Pin-like site-specific DNA recombinase
MFLAMRTVIYARLSRKTDTNELNLEDQLKRCTEYANKQGWTITAQCSDYGESAFDRDDIEDRPGFAEVLGHIRSGEIDAVLAWRPDRLFRDPIEQALFFRECQRKKVNTVATVTEGARDPSNAGDEMVGTIVAAVSRYESNAKRARLIAKHRQLAEQGKVVGGGHRPLGYDKDRKTIVEHEADAIRWAAEHVIAGGSIRSVLRGWDERGLVSTSGLAWNPGAAKRVLTGARWAGLRSHKGKVVAEAEWPAIITVEQLAQLREILLDPARNRRTYQRPYLLTGGLAICGCCEANLVSRPRGDHQRCYVCATGVGFKGCGKIRRLSEPVEDEVVARFFAAINDGTLADAEPEPGPDLAGITLVEIESALAGLSRDHYVLKVISRGEFLAAREPLSAQAEVLRARLNMPTMPKVTLASVRDAWPSMTVEERKVALSVFIDVVVFHPTVKGRNTFDPSKIEVRWKV